MSQSPVGFSTDPYRAVFGEIHLATTDFQPHFRYPNSAFRIGRPCLTSHLFPLNYRRFQGKNYRGTLP
jgi:hypothetical protein